MTEAEFRPFIRDLCLYYERKEPFRDTRDLWFSRVARLPAEFLPWAKKTIADRFDMFPRNIPNVLKSLWDEWLAAHPEKRGDHLVNPKCSNPWCENGVLFTGKVDDDGVYRQYVFGCRVCGGGPRAYPAATPGELVEKGFEHLTQEAAIDRVRKTIESVPLNRRGQLDWKAMAKRGIADAAVQG